MTDHNKFGRWLQQARIAAGLTQKALADKVRVHQPDISQYESGTHLPASEMCRAFAALFGESIELVLRLVSDTDLVRKMRDATSQSIPIKDIKQAMVSHSANDEEPHKSHSNGDTLLTVAEAALALGLTGRRVSKLCSEGRLGRRYGKRLYLIAPDELEKFSKVPRRPGPRKKTSGTTRESTPRKTYALMGPDGRAYESLVAGALGGHRKTRVYGRLNCPAAVAALQRGGYKAERVFFLDEATAISAGYRPCARCMPELYREWRASNSERGSKTKSSLLPQVHKETKNMEVWPSRTDTRRVDLEVHAQLEHTPNWFGGTGNGRYHNPWNALCEKNGAVALFALKGANKGFRSHGRCLFFAVAEESADTIFATTDGKILCRLKRADVGNRRIEDVSVEEMKRLCLLPETSRREFDSL